MSKEITKKLESLNPQQQEWVLDLAAHAARLKDVIDPLRKHGIEISVSTLTRFVRRHREKILAEEGQDMKGAVEALANRGQGEALRKGTLEAVRQRLYEEALNATNSPEQTLKMYGELLKEEAKLKELALAERKMAVAEEELRLEKVRLRLAARAQGGKRLVKLKAVSVVENAVAARQLEEKAASLADAKSTPALAVVEVGERKRALELVGQLDCIVNGAGRAEDKVMAARAALVSEQKLVQAAKERVTEEVKNE